MPYERLRPGYAFGEDRVEQLKSVVPEAFADGKIDWDVLREALGEFIESETGEVEHFGMSWPGKREARRLASAPSEGNLVPCSGEGVDEETTRNIFIEGDNLEVLKLLQRSYAGQIRMIYIDPPYNTGNDFVYEDDFVQPLEQYLKLTRQMDEEGVVLTTNPRSGGRFHSKWLSMMYPRLLLARNLLRPDGVMFVSIDDNEAYHLRQVLNEVFGEENFIAQITWKKKTGAGSGIAHVFNEHEYVVAYGRDVSSMPRWRIVGKEEGNFRNPDNDPRGPWESCAFTAPSKNRNPNQLFMIEIHFDSTDERIPEIDEDGRAAFERFLYQGHVVVLRNIRQDDGVDSASFDKENRVARFIKRWAYTKNSIRQVFQHEKVYFSGRNVPRFKKFESEYQGKALRSIYYSEFSTQQGTEALRSLFGESYLEYPKPVALIRHLAHATTDGTDIIMDFFSGSSTSAHSVMDLNEEDGGDRRFIMVQLPEPCDKNSSAFEHGYVTVADIGKERIRRVIRQKKERKAQIDLGFRVFRLDRSNLKAWQDYQGQDVPQLETLFTDNEVPLIAGWTPDSLLTEVILMQGFALDSTVTRLYEFSSNAVLKVESVISDHQLLVCLDERIHDETIERLKLHGEDTFVCLDSALTDQAKVSLSDKCNLATI